jgi:hypothetical protein
MDAGNVNFQVEAPVGATLAALQELIVAAFFVAGVTIDFSDEGSNELYCVTSDIINVKFVIETDIVH